MYFTLLMTLIIAICLALIFGITTLWLTFRYRNHHIKQNYTSSHFNAFNQQNDGELLWSLKRQTRNPLQDEVLIYALNTVLRNHYTISCVQGFESSYELETLRQKGQQVIDCRNFDFLLINYDEATISDSIAVNIEKLNNRGLIFIANPPRQSNVNLQLLEFLQENKIRFNYEWIGKGIILIAK